MFEISSKKVDFEKDNILIKRNINLDTNLDCFILISTNNSNFWDLLLNNILDFLIDKISKKNAYNDFSIALESINHFIKKWEIDSTKEIKTDIIISILNDNNYIFSNIWKSSCYLLNNKNELIELTNKEDNKRYFNYLSSWELLNNEIIVSSTKRLLNYLSKSDLIDWLVLSEDIKIFNKNIYNILMSELLEENILVSSMKYNSSENLEKPDKLDILKEYLIKSLDNKFSKNVIWYLLIIKDKINSQTKMIKNIILLTWIILSIFFLYSTISGIVWVTVQNEWNDLAKENIIKAKSYLTIASENMSNIEVFELNINKSKELLNSIQDKKIFLADIEKLNDTINILKKQFNKVEVFEETPENIIYSWTFTNPVKLLKNSLKPYIITSNWVVWPIMPNTIAKNYVFNSLAENEHFVDATFIWDNMYILTNLSKVVKFTKNWYFSYIDVSWQQKWQNSKEIDSYNQNLYLIWKDNNQVYKHSQSWNLFKIWEKYLKDGDQKEIWEILSIAIDWAFYILKKDLSIIKFYSNPYRLEKIVLNKLPENYDIEKANSIIDLKTRPELNYVYMLLNNKIWVFKPDNKDYKSTKSLTYMWQIEWEKEIIKDFYINRDWEVIILNNKWLFQINFEISDSRLLIR